MTSTFRSHSFRDSIGGLVWAFNQPESGTISQVNFLTDSFSQDTIKENINHLNSCDQKYFENILQKKKEKKNHQAHAIEYRCFLNKNDQIKYEGINRGRQYISQYSPKFGNIETLQNETHKLWLIVKTLQKKIHKIKEYQETHHLIYVMEPISLYPLQLIQSGRKLVEWRQPYYNGAHDSLLQLQNGQFFKQKMQEIKASIEQRKARLITAPNTNQRHRKNGKIKTKTKPIEIKNHIVKLRFDLIAFIEQRNEEKPSYSVKQDSEVDYIIDYVYSNWKIPRERFLSARDLNLSIKHFNFRNDRNNIDLLDLKQLLEKYSPQEHEAAS